MFNLRLCNAATIRYSQLKFGHMHLCGMNYKCFSPQCCKCYSLGCTAAIRCGNACQGPHSDSLYSGCEHIQFNSGPWSARLMHGACVSILGSVRLCKYTEVRALRIFTPYAARCYLLSKRPNISASSYQMTSAGLPTCRLSLAKPPPPKLSSEKRT